MKERHKKSNKNKLKWLILSCIAAVIIISAIITYCSFFANSYDPNNATQVVIEQQDRMEFVIPSGANTTQIAELLKKQGIIGNVNIFKILSRINGYDGKYQAGTHILSKSLSYNQVMTVLTRKPSIKRVTIPEGKSFIQIVDILYSNKIISDKNSFIKLANTGEFDYAFLKNLPARDNKLEGYLFPDTYDFDTNASDANIITIMLNNFDSKIKPEYYSQIKNLKGNMTLDKVIILASIIEREGRNPADLGKISGVFYNRLTNSDKTLRKLQSCATIQYILLKTTGATKTRLYNKDLAIDDPYNTYLYEGLPPGPICCPGESAIKAAFYPEQTEYLYFVAKGDTLGSHQFSATYKEHLAAIQKYGLH